MVLFSHQNSAVGKPPAPATERGIFTFPTESLLGPLNDVEQRYAPKYLYAAGNPELLRAGPRVAIIGTREPSEEGARNATALAKALVGAGITIVSGLAKGIDAIAHQAAIEAGGGTIAVLGTPLDKFYPAENRALQKLIMHDHLALSQFPLGAPIERKNFPLRNRTMALISHASVIIEAGDTSGSLHQGWEALRLRRPLFIHKAIIRNPKLRWPAEMVRYGAMVLSKPAEVIQALPAGAGLELDVAP